MPNIAISSYYVATGHTVFHSKAHIFSNCAFTKIFKPSAYTYLKNTE